MFDWIKNINREHPEFWKRYLSKFEQKSKRFVVISLETSGHLAEKDVIFSIGAIGIANDAIYVGDAFEVMIPQYKFLHDNGMSNEFIIESDMEKRTEQQALEAFVEYIGNAGLVGYRIHHDVDMINEALARIGAGRLRNEALDIEIMFKKFMDSDKPASVSDMSNQFKIQIPQRISATDDAYTNALLFLKLKTKLGIH